MEVRLFFLQQVNSIDVKYEGLSIGLSSVAIKMEFFFFSYSNSG